MYDVTESRDPVTRQRVYDEDTSTKSPSSSSCGALRSRTRSGVFKSDLRLFGVDDPARLPWGTNNLGKDVFTRVLYGGQVSLTVGLLPSG